MSNVELPEVRGVLSWPPADVVVPCFFFSFPPFGRCVRILLPNVSSSSDSSSSSKAGAVSSPPSRRFLFFGGAAPVAARADDEAEEEEDLCAQSIIFSQLTAHILLEFGGEFDRFLLLILLISLLFIA